MLRRLLPLLALAAAAPAAAAVGVVVTAAEPGEPWTNWATVAVRWENAEVDLARDWVGAFLEGWNATYVLWRPLTDSDPLSPGRGSLSFRLLNGRHPYVFRYFRGDDVLGESNRVAPLGRTPLQGHLSLVPGHTDRMALVWVSNSSEPQAVRWGAAADDLAQATEDVKSETITSQEFTDCMNLTAIAPRAAPFANISTHDIRCGGDCYPETAASELFLDPGFIHTAVLSPLPAPGTKVFYSFGAAAAPEGDLARSATYAFKSPRQPGDSTPFSILVTADAGIGRPSPEEMGGATDNDPPVNGADAVFAAMLRDGPLSPHSTDEFLLVNGDISYARGWPWIWERYFDMVQPLATALPFLTAVGNHEIDTSANSLKLASGHDSGGECGVATLKRFPHYPALDRMYYAFSYASVHVVMLSSEHPMEDQVAFFEADMAALDRALTPWVVVGLHRPMFGSCKLDGMDKLLQTTWHTRFVKHGVDFVLMGHEHRYERLCAVESDSACATGRDRPVYVVDGSAGAEFSPTKDPHNPSNISMYKDFSLWGYSRLLVTPEALTFVHYHTDNTVVDQVTLPKLHYNADIPLTV